MEPVTLTDEEARVVGALMEKAVTTPDNYPLSSNALVIACNQTTNREPVVSYDEDTVEQVLLALREKGLVRRVMSTGQRVPKHRHVVDEALGLDAAELSVLGVLLLRAAQTPGELKARTDRWHRFRSLADVEDVLGRLAARGLAVQLPRRPGHKEARWAQRLTGAPAGTGPDHEPRASPVPTPAPDAGEPGAEPVQRPEPQRNAQPLAHSIEVRDPATGEVLRTVAVTEEGEIAQKLERARLAQGGWAERPYEARAAVMRAFRDLLADEADDCARVTTSEVGKPIRQSRAEVAAVLERIDWNVEKAGALIEARTVSETERFVERVTYEPVGVVAHVSAWNYPYFVGLNSVVPALLTGNAVLYKPSELATSTGLRLVDLMHRAGVPVDVVQAVVGAGPTGAALVAADVDMVCFTGSHATGQQVARAAGDRLVRVQLELGGKDPAYVCDDVDVEEAALAVAEGAFYNAGQSCSATERVYVHESVHDTFLDAFAEVVRSYRVGDPLDEATDVGPLARAAQLEVLERQVADALAKGARLVCGGERIDRPGNWFAPTVLSGVDDRMAIVTEESFGPVVGVEAVRDDDEATARMDATEYGLGAAVFSRDRTRAEAILRRLDVGNAYWNTADRSCVRLPWTGRRHSGLGVSMSEAGVRTFVREKAWHLFRP